MAQALRPYPQYQAIEYRDMPIGKSRYDSFQIKLDKRFANGLQFRTFYVWARLCNNRAESGQRGGGGVQNPINTQAGEWTIAAITCRTRSSSPAPTSCRSAKARAGSRAQAAQGWTVNGIMRYDSGRPLAITMNNDLAGLAVQHHQASEPQHGGQGVATFQDGFDPNRDRYFDRAAWTDPGPLQFGNAPSRDGDRARIQEYVEDVSIFKVTTLGRPLPATVRNARREYHNRVVFCDPNTNCSAAQFGRTGIQCNQPRSVQFGMKFEYWSPGSAM